MTDKPAVKYLTPCGGLPCGNYPKNELVKYVRADIAEDMLYALKGFCRAVESDIVRVRPSDIDQFTDVLAAANEAIAKAEGGEGSHTRAAPKVKALEWVDKTKPDRWVEHYVAGVKGERRYFSITRQNSIGQTMYELESSFVPGRRRFSSIEKAKDAAQSEHARRILDALE